MYADRSFKAARLISLPFKSDTGSIKSNETQHCLNLRINNSSCSRLELSTAKKKINFFVLKIYRRKIKITNSPLRSGNCCSSTSCEFRYRDDPCDFLLFFFSDRLANGSIRSTNVPEDITISS